MRSTRKILTYKTSGFAPGYRDLDLILVDQDGVEYELKLPPEKVQSVIFACADVAQQIGTEPPIDWERWPATICWPQVTTWRPGASTSKKTEAA